MTSEEKFMFDLEGYLVVKNVLTPREVADMNATTDEVFPSNYDETGTHGVSRVTLWGPAFQDLIDHPKIVPYLSELLGPKFRIDHDYCIFMTKGGKRGGLHGGETDRAPDHWYKYKDGVMRNGLTVVTYFLAPAKAGDGGFACIPGSHKSNFVTSLPKDVRAFERPAHYCCPARSRSGRRPHLHRGPHPRHPALDGRPRTEVAPLQIQPRALRLVSKLLHPGRIQRPHRTAEAHPGGALCGPPARQCGSHPLKRPSISTSTSCRSRLAQIAIAVKQKSRSIPPVSPDLHRHLRHLPVIGRGVFPPGRRHRVPVPDHLSFSEGQLTNQPVLAVHPGVPAIPVGKFSLQMLQHGHIRFGPHAQRPQLRTSNRPGGRHRGPIDHLL